MLLGHLAPCGPIAAAVERHWRPEWPRWTRALPWLAAIAGCILPDLDVVANILLNGVWLHLYYWPHSIFSYLPLLVAGWWLARTPRTRLVGWTVLTLWAGVLSHLLLDTVSHGVLLFYPLWNGVVGWTYPNAGEHIVLAYLGSANFWLELGVILAAGAWWLNRYAPLWEGAWPARTRRVPLGRLSALPRHEGSRPLWLLSNPSSNGNDPPGGLY